MAVIDDPQIRIIVGGLEQFSERQIIQLSLEVTANLIETTPVDLGWARANWVPSIGQPYDVVVGQPNDSSDVGAARRKQAEGRNALRGYKLTRGPIFVSNNVPYIQKLNEGSSAQAPAGFVQMAIQTAIATVQGAR